MNTLKKIVMILLFLLFCQYGIADCGHCFSIVKIKILYNNGNTEISNLKFFRQYVLENNEIQPKENESIKKYFSKSYGTIQLIDSIYQLENLPAFINKESKRDVSLKEIKDIYLLEWTTIGGAFELPYLSSETIKRIINSDTLFVNTKIFHGYDENYIYTGTNLSLEDFNMLIEESHNYEDVEPSIIGRLKINRRKKIYPDKVELNKAFDYYFEEINRSICTTSEIRINEGIDEYFRIYNSDLKKRKRYVESVLDYLNTSISTNLEGFISDNVEDCYKKNALFIEIDKERDIIKKTIALVERLYFFKEDHILNQKFYKTLKEENVIILSVGWD